jgi:hypothetical protein
MPIPSQKGVQRTGVQWNASLADTSLYEGERVLWLSQDEALPLSF